MFESLVMLATLLFVGIGAVLGDDSVIAYVAFAVFGIVELIFICPSVSVMVRRLHDIGLSGWWYWTCLIPYVGGIVDLVFFLIGRQEHDNEYGPYVRYKD